MTKPGGIFLLLLLGCLASPLRAMPDAPVSPEKPVLNLVPPFSSATSGTLSLTPFAYIHHEGGVRLPFSSITPYSFHGYFIALERLKSEYSSGFGRLPEIFSLNPVWLMIPFQDYASWQGTVLSIFSDGSVVQEMIIVDEDNLRTSYTDKALEQFHLFSSAIRTDYILPSPFNPGEAAVFIRLERLKNEISNIQLTKIPEYSKSGVIHGVAYSFAYSAVIFLLVMAFVLLNLQNRGNILVFVFYSLYALIFGVVSFFPGCLSVLGLDLPKASFAVNIISCFYPLGLFLLSVIWNKSRTVQLVYLLTLLSITLILGSMVLVRAYSVSETGMYVLLLITSTAVLMPGFLDSFIEKSFRKYYLAIYVSHALAAVFLLVTTFFFASFSFRNRSAVLFGVMLCSMLMVSFASIVSYLKWRKRQNRIFSLLRQKDGRLTEEKKEFIKSVASLLRSPLNRMVSLLEDREVDLNTGGRAVEIALAKNEAVNLLNIVSNIVSYVNLKDGSRNLAAEPFSLASSVNSAIQLVGYFTASNKIRFEQAIPSIELVNDIKTVQELIYNTIYRSAITESVRQIGVKASVLDSTVFLAISDDGKAMVGANAFSGSPGVVWGDSEEGPNSEEDMDLVLTSRLASLIGGKFKYSKSAGGTVYEFELPLSFSFPDRSAQADSSYSETRSDQTGQTAVSASIPSGLNPGRKTRQDQDAFSSAYSVLVVDDEPVSLFTLKRRIEVEGWNVYARISSWQALDFLKDDNYCDVVIVDSLMPEMSGFEFTRLLRDYYPREKLPVIILIDAGRPEEIEEVFKSGADDYLVRPIGAVELLSKIRTHADLARSMRRELEQRDKMSEIDKLKTLGWLTAGVAHEINTPNNSILRNVPILKEIWSELSPVLEKLFAAEGEFNIRGFSAKDLRDEIPEMYNDLYIGAQHIKKIVEDLKEYARGPRGEGMVPIDVNLAVRYAVRLLKHSIAVCTKKFTVSIAEDLSFIVGDKLKLTQVVVNILENALQSLPSTDSAVSVETFFEHSGDTEFPLGQVGVRVSDQGVGMSPEVLASVFNPFFTTKREKGGTGLGMPVVAGIVREFGGMITIDSKPDKGTVVTVMFPIHNEPELEQLKKGEVV